MTTSNPEQSPLHQIIQSLRQVFIGDTVAVEKALIAVLARGHLLIEDVPGVGKTTLARALAESCGGKFQHIQFTSDLLPSDILGVNIFNPQKNGFSFHEGPIFANFILADELNRTTPKTQSALLEAMQSGMVTIEKNTYQLPAPFMVIATQNPLEIHGTFPLPLSQLDRFMMRIALGYPTPDQEAEILVSYRQNLVHPLTPIVEPNLLLKWRAQVSQIHVDPSLVRYLTELGAATRNHDQLAMGASPRALLGLQNAAQARAFLHGRQFVTPDDIKSLAVDCLAHRLAPTVSSALSEHIHQRNASILNELINTIPVPV